jgi:hypothetical protein
MHTSLLQSALVERNIVTPEEMAYTRRVVGTDFHWLELLVSWRIVDEWQVLMQAESIARVPRTNLDRLSRIEHSVLATVPPEVAADLHVIPVGIERDGDLWVAMADPTDEGAVEQLEFFCDRHVLREVAPTTPIAWALHAYYGVATALWPPPRRAELRRAA